MDEHRRGASLGLAALRVLRRVRVVVVLATVVGVGCGDGDGPVDPPSEPPRATAISISPQSVTLVTIGETATFTASLIDQFGAAFAGTITWSSSDPEVFTVDAGGVVTAVANGAGTLTATYQALSATASVTVLEPPRAVALTVSPDSVMLTALGETTTFTAELIDQFGAVFDAAVTWSSSDTEVFTVDAAGVVTAVANGSGVLTATYEDLSATASVTVFEPSRAAAITVSPDSVMLTAIGETTTFTAELTDQFGAVFDAAVTWSSSDVSVFTVDDAGIATAVGSGSATLGATFEDLSAEALVIVNLPPEPRGSLPDVALAAGAGPITVSPTPYFDDPDGEELHLTFSASSSDSSVAIVSVLVDDEHHVLVRFQGTAPGSTTAIVTATDPGGLSHSREVAVTVDDSGATPLSTIVVSDNVLEIGQLVVSGSCSQPLVNMPTADGFAITIGSSVWQTRSDSTVVWTDVSGTRRNTGQLCSHTTGIPGEYRLVFEVTWFFSEGHDTVSGLYRAASTFFVEDDGNRSPTIVPGAPTSGQVSVGGGVFLLNPLVVFSDPDGDLMTYSVDVSDSSVLATQVIVDAAGNAFVAAAAEATGSATLTLRATDPGGRWVDLAIAMTVSDGGYTLTSALGTVSNGFIHILGRDLPICFPPVVELTARDGITYTVNAAWWQRRDDASAEWATVEGTELTDGTVCPYATQVPGDYRLALEMTLSVVPHVQMFRGNYASNVFTVAGATDLPPGA